MVIDNSKCAGSAMCFNYCRPDEEKHACILPDDASRNCPRDPRIYSGGTVHDIQSYKWAYEKLSPVAKALSGKFIQKSDFDSLDENDRWNLCGAYPNDLCMMSWNEEKKTTECTLGKVNCGECLYQGVPIICQAKNKCNGVICL